MSKTDKLVVTKMIGIIRDGMTGEELQALLDDAMVESLNVRVSVIRGYSYDDYNNGNDEYELIADRLETDEEYKRRLNADKKRKEAKKLKKQSDLAQKEEKDRKLFEELKKKFMSES